MKVVVANNLTAVTEGLTKVLTANTPALYRDACKHLMHTLADEATSRGYMDGHPTQHARWLQIGECLRRCAARVAATPSVTEGE